MRLVSWDTKNSSRSEGASWPLLQLCTDVERGSSGDVKQESQI